ncbi:Conserved hypothetical protein [Leptospira biflexa serovar Patoc strain 'Patoc 1 (Ames)']|uniref:Uncharacterized protein n=1 Tax=Leptospira biflexa serovar Patoc (strain Patoc 1 / ATCC 23582 / Paris) TaxID=456481 RepID=B0SN99_LEPBP|nr:hypothetical protein [Leptospira biflexa]ABZ95186.1 Conserved hypothetical protein [Leptospira biflexa serovar Patoc strain 'Patoc 1 (Ames)']ABZ98866.1 Hypothetical protein LEPBI_I2789 [Leptospira biflexa serovar Patoc strain 'Patoc 1 (Paris)']
MRILSFSLILPLLFFCKPPDLSNGCDPNSKSYLLGTILRYVTSDNSPSCLPSFSPFDIDYWGVFGGSATVNSMEIYGNELILGGSFNALGPNVGSTYYLDTNTGKIVSNFECPFLKLNDLAKVVVSDGNGGFYIAGNFTYVRGTPIQNVVHMLPDCKIDPNFTPNPGSPPNIYSMVMFGDKLYIGGVFNSWEGNARNNLVSINRFSGALESLAMDVNSAVEKLLIYDQKLYIAGQFSTVNGFARDRIARIDLSNSTLDSFVPSSALNSTVRALAFGTISGTPAIIVGGAFTTPRNNVFALDLNGTVLAWDPNFNGIVDAIAVSGQKVYVGGSFTAVNGGTARPNFAVVDSNTGTDIGINYALNGNVHQVIESNGQIYLFGSFTSVLGENRNYGASIDSNTNSIREWNPRFLNPFSYPSASAGFSLDGSRIMIPGGNGTVNYVDRSNIASVYLDSGLPTNWAPSIDNEVAVLHIKNDHLFIGGYFATISGLSRTRLAAFRLPSYELSSFNPTITTGNVTQLISDETNFYFAGTFTTVSGSARSNAAAYSLDNFSLTNWAPDPNNQVSSILDLGDSILLGGLFNTAGGSASSFIRAVNKSDGLAISIPTSFPDSDVSGFASYNGIIYVGGNFSTIGGSNNQYLASFTKGTGVFESNKFQLNGGVFYQMIISNDGLMVLHGGFTSVNTTNASGTAFINLNTNQIKAWEVTQTGVTFNQKLFGKYLFIGGNITERGNQPFGGYHRIELPKLESF